MELWTLENQLVHDLKDLHSAESQAAEHLPQLAANCHQPVVQNELDQYADSVRKHVEQVESLLTEHRSRPGGKPCHAIEALIEADQILLGRSADDTVKDIAIVGAVSRIQHYKLGGYCCLLTMAIALNDDSAASVLDWLLKEEQSAIQSLLDSGLLVTTKAPKGNGS